MEQPVNTLSGGQQKRLAMAKVLINANRMCSSSTSPPTTSI
jgi:ABC-type phosphate/phosphonate transport system ATPase subunit